MALTVSGRYNDFIVDTSDYMLSPRDAYAAWAAELGVPDTGTLYALDADDQAFAIDFAASSMTGGIVAGSFSSEGALGFYGEGAPVGASTAVNLPGVSRMYLLNPYPDVLLSFHPQVDCRSEGIKLQRSGSTTIITGLIRSYATQSSRLQFAIRLNGADNWQAVFTAIDAPVDIILFPWGVQYADLSETVTTVPVGKNTLVAFTLGKATYVAPSPSFHLAGTLMRRLTDIPVVHTYHYLPAIPILKDAVHGGNGRVAGTIKEAGIPDAPVQRKVRLHRKQDGMLIREQWSAADGGYAFNNIAIQPYYVVSFDHTGNYNGVIKDSIVPEVMP